jgi:hypothetical protein
MLVLIATECKIFFCDSQEKNAKYVEKTKFYYQQNNEQVFNIGVWSFFLTRPSGSNGDQFSYSEYAYTFSSAYCGYQIRYALLSANHRDTEGTEGTIFSPDRETTAIGQEIAALRARSSNPVVSCQGLEPGSRASATGGGSFPWPSSPGQGKNNILCVLCASVVNLRSGFIF